MPKISEKFSGWKRDMVKNELQFELGLESLWAWVEGLKARVEIQKWEFKSTGYELKYTHYEFKSTSYELKFTSYEFKSTKLRIIKSVKTQVNTLLKQPSKTYFLKS